MALTPQDINTLVKAVEQDVRGVIKTYFDVRIAEDLDPVKINVAELFETMIEMASRLTVLEDAVLPDGATHEPDDKPV